MAEAVLAALVIHLQHQQVKGIPVVMAQALLQIMALAVVAGQVLPAALQMDWAKTGQQLREVTAVLLHLQVFLVLQFITLEGAEAGLMEVALLV